MTGRSRLYTYDVATFIALVANLLCAGFSAVLAQMSLLVAVIAESIVHESAAFQVQAIKCYANLFLPNVSRFAAILGLMTICVWQATTRYTELNVRYKKASEIYGKARKKFSKIIR